MPQKSEYQPKWVLALDTTTPEQSIALAASGELRANLTLSVKTSHTQTILSGIDYILGCQGLKLPDLAAVASVSGPGSFTGIRIGLAVGQGLADTLQIPLIGRTALELHAWAAEVMEGVVCPLLDASRGNFYSAVYQRSSTGLDVVEEGRELSAVDVVTLLDKYPGAYLTGPAWRGVWGRLPSTWTERYPHPPGARQSVAVILACLGSLNWENVVKEERPDAYYIRPPDVRRKVPPVVKPRPGNKP